MEFGVIDMLDVGDLEGEREAWEVMRNFFP